MTAALVNPDLEALVLAAVVDPKIAAYAKAAEAGITAKSWGIFQHAALWVVICRVVAAGKPVDVWSVYEEAQRCTVGEIRDLVKGNITSGDTATGQASELLTIAWLSDLGNVAGPVTQAERNIASLTLLARQRQILAAGTALVAHLGKPVAADALDTALAELLAVGTATTDKASVGGGEALDLMLARHDAIKADGGRASWGVESLDDAIPLAQGRMIVVAAPPGCGKTAIMLQSAKETAWRLSGAAAFLSLEVGPEDLALRLVSSMAVVDLKAVQMGLLTKAEREVITSQRAQIEASGLQFRAPASPQVDACCGWIRAQHQRAGGRLRLVCVDYLQKIQTSNPRHTENDRLTEICGKLSRLSVELNICILAGSQFSRKGTEGTRGKNGEIDTSQPEPRASDLRGSGSIEQDANGIVGLWRKQHTDQTGCEVTACIIKNREGQSGNKIPLWWDKPTGKWSHVVPHHDRQLAERGERMKALPSDEEENVF